MSVVQIASLDCSTMVASSRFLDSLRPREAIRPSMLFAMLLKASAASGHFRRAFRLDAHGVVALAEAVRAFGEQAQRVEVAAEDQPDELQHEEQRHRQDLQLLEELLPRAGYRT
jgi:hypothetical protein